MHLSTPTPTWSTINQSRRPPPGLSRFEGDERLGSSTRNTCPVVLDTSMTGLKPDTAGEGGYEVPRPSRRLAVRTPGVGVAVYGRG